MHAIVVPRRVHQETHSHCLIGHHRKLKRHRVWLQDLNSYAGLQLGGDLDHVGIVVGDCDESNTLVMVEIKMLGDVGLLVDPHCGAS